MVNSKNRVNNLFQNAIEDGRRRNYAAAVKKLRNVLNLSDDIPEALLYLGRACHELGNFDDAIISLRLYITKAPKSGAGYFYLGRTYIATGKFHRAASCFNEALRLKPDFAPSLVYLGYAMLRCGRPEKAVDYLSKAIAEEPNNKKVNTMYINSILVLSLKEFRNENYQKALKGLLFLEDSGFTSLTTKLYTGIIYKELKEYVKAAKYIYYAASIVPEDPLVKNILAELYMLVGDIDSAFELLSTYKEQDEIKSFLNTLDNTGQSFAVAFWLKKDYSTALYYAISSLKKERTYDMHLLAGECLKNSGRLEESYNHFTRASEINNKTVEPYYGRASVRWLDNDYSGVDSELDKIEIKNPDDDFAEYYRILCSWKLNKDYNTWKPAVENRLKKEKDGWLLTAKGYGEMSVSDYLRAYSSFKNALKIENSLSDAWNGLIESAEPAGKPLLPVLKKYLSFYENDTERRILYAGMLARNGDYRTASDQYRIIASLSNEIFYIKKLAYCCRKAGIYREASILYRQLLSNSPFNEEYLKLLLFCMRKEGRDSETLPLLKSAIEAFKKPSVDLLLVYGVTLYKNGMDEEALNVFQKCIYNGISDRRVYYNMSVIYHKKGLIEWAEMYRKKAEQSKKK